MEKKNKEIKSIRLVILLISIINIIFCLVTALILENFHSFNESLKPTSINIDILLFSVLVLNIFNIVIELKTNKRWLLIIGLVIILITPLIPVRRVNSIRYTHNEENGIMGTTTYTNEYKNIYSITLNKSQRTNLGYDIY